MNREILLLGVRVGAFFLVALIVWLALAVLRGLLAKDDRGDRKNHRSVTGEKVPLPPGASRDCAPGAGTLRKTVKRVSGFFAGRQAASPCDHDVPDAPGADLPLTIMARFGRSFSAGDIDDLVKTFGLRRSPVDGYELLNENGRDVLFTLRAVDRRGRFPEVRQEGDTIDGLLLVMRLPNGHDAVKSCETFSALAKEMAEACDGRLCDFIGRPMENKGLIAYRAAAGQFQQEYDTWLARCQEGS